MKKALIITSCVSAILVIAVSIETTLLINNWSSNRTQQTVSEQTLGHDCVKHIKNLVAGANANLSDLGTYGTVPPGQSGALIEWQEIAQCMVSYPLYNNSSGSFGYNLSLY